MEEHRESQDYEAPVVIDYGDLNDLTGGTSDGERLDAAFPAQTSKHDLTFS